jgi:hypothetical protein
MIVAGMASVICGLITGICGIAELLRYSAAEDPGALGTGYAFAGAGLLLIATPLVVSLGRFALYETRAYRAWKARLTSAQRVWVTLAEAAAFWGGHELWKHHNERESARLTRSVMGPERD